MWRDGDEQTTDVTFGGIPVWLLIAYLEELGGVRAGADSVAGEGWTARLAAVPAGAGAPIPRVRVSIEGPRAPAVMAELRKKAVRGGG